MGLNLDPGIKAYIDLANELYDDEADHGSIEDQRQAYLDLCGAFARPHPPGVKAMDRTIKANGVTIFLIEHYVEFVMDISDTVTVLDFGRKIAEGRPEQVRRDPAVVAAYLGSDT